MSIYIHARKESNIPCECLLGTDVGQLLMTCFVHLVQAHRPNHFIKNGLHMREVVATGREEFHLPVQILYFSKPTSVATNVGGFCTFTLCRQQRLAEIVVW